MSTRTDIPKEDLDSITTKRMERWFLSPKLRDFMSAAKDVKKPEGTGPYIAFSRQPGSEGDRVARMVGQTLDWDVLDKELLDFMTQRYNLPREMLELVDETKANWFHDVLGAFADARVVSHDSYVVHMERIMYLAALHGNVVFIGRGANFALPSQSGLSVRIVAPRKQRIKRAMEHQQLDRAKAVKWIDKIEKDRRDFCKRHFHHDIDKADEFDLSINMEKLSAETVAQMIVQAARELGLATEPDDE